MVSILFASMVSSMDKIKPKIAIVVNTAWNIYNFRLGLIKHLLQQGHEVVAIAPADDYVSKITETGCQFVALKNLSRKGTNPIYDLQLAREFYQIFKRKKIDIALLYTIKPNIYASLGGYWAGTKTVASVTGLGYAFLSDGLVNKIVKRLYKFAFSKSNKVVFQNGDDLKLFVESGWAEESKTQIIHGSGINTTIFKPEIVEKEENTVDFLFIGRLLFDKGIREYMTASEKIASQYSNTKFWILGAFDEGNPSGISKNYLDNWMKNPQMTYFGVTDDTRPYITKADVIVLPSYREGLPRVNLEGMSMSKPLLSTNVTGCRDTVDDGINGFLVKVKDSEDLASGMTKLIELGTARRNEMGKKGRTKVLGEFDEKIVIQNYVDLIAELNDNQ